MSLMKQLQYQVNHKTKEFLVMTISYNLAELKKAMEKENAAEYSVVHVLSPKNTNIKYVPNNLVMD